MGNCQAIDAATLVIQHPSGRAEKLYWPVSASEVMRTNPGHYVALIITWCLPEQEKPENSAVRVTRLKLLRPTDTLALGHVYRLISTQEVLKELLAKKSAKTKKNQSSGKPGRTSENQRTVCEETETSRSQLRDTNQQSTAKHERHRPRTASTGSSVARSRSWRPSLQSISEAAS